MLLCDLPEVIIATILEGCVGASGNSAYGLKRKLPLLAVCQQWRRIAIPLVHGNVFVQYGVYSDFEDVSFTDVSNWEEPTNVAVKTNLDLIAVAGCAHAVKRVQIGVHCLIDPFPGWRDVIRRMRTAASKWPVVELAVNMEPEFNYYDPSPVDLPNNAGDVADVSDMLTALMPDVCSLECGDNCNSITRPLCGRLVSHYAEQLQRFESHRPMSMPLGCELMIPKRFPTAYRLVDGYQLPQIASGELVDLRLVNGPYGHSWASFSTDSDKWAVEFPNLKRLHFAYSTDDQETGITARHRDGHPWELHFPSLERLSIRCSRGACPLLEYAALPPRMESITIDMESAAYLDIASAVLPTTRCLSICITGYASGDPSGLPAVNRILNKARGSEVLKLKLADKRLRVGPESITCAALTHLEISAPTSVDTMLAVIKTLPNLVKLTLYDLDMSDIQVDISIPDADQDAAMEPLHSSLQSLKIGSGRNRLVRESAAAVALVAVLKCMLLRIPTLTRVHSREIPKEPVLDFVRAHELRYPRLRSLVLDRRSV